MLSVSLLVVTLAMPATGQQTRLELTASGSVGYTGHTYTPAGFPPGIVSTNSHETSGGADVTAVLYLRPVADDDAAPSLQPFLQRTNRFSLGGGGGAFAVADDLGGPLQGRRGSNGNAWLSVDGYFGP